MRAEILTLSAMIMASGLAQCGKAEQVVPYAETMKGLMYQGPHVLCDELEKIIAAPPPDITPRQIRTAKASRDVCRLPVDDVTLEKTLAVLDGKDMAYEAAGDIFTLYIQTKSDDDELQIMDSLQTKINAIGIHKGETVFAGRFRLKDLDAARLRFFRPDFSGDPLLFRGPDAPQDVVLDPELRGAFRDDLTLESAALGETRRYNLYTSPGFKPGDKAFVVVLADGRSAPYYARQWEPLVRAGEMAPIIVVGIPSGEKAIVDVRESQNYDVRNADYIHDFEAAPERFGQHLAFVSDELLPKIAADLGVEIRAERTAILGGSSGGSFAVWAALERPDKFGHSVAMSPSGPIPVQGNISDDAKNVQFYLSAGHYEPGYKINAMMDADIFTEQGARVDLRFYSDGHSADHRDLRMAEVLPRIFPPDKND